MCLLLTDGCLKACVKKDFEAVSRCSGKVLSSIADVLDLEGRCDGICIMHLCPDP